MKTTRANLNRKGFTLIEMLVVIAIIAILAGILFPTISKGILTSKVNKAEIEAKAIAGAVNLFYRDYGYMPVPAANQGDASDETSQSLNDVSYSVAIMKVLMGENTDNLNPKKKRYLDSDTPIANGVFEDPWGNQYRIKLDLDYNGKLELFNTSTPYNQRVIVISVGPDSELGSSITSNEFEDNVANVFLEIN